jgi:hypothetical protein
MEVYVRKKGKSQVYDNLRAERAEIRLNKTSKRKLQRMHWESVT